MKTKKPMLPTPNDTPQKQFLTALSLTVFFLLGILSCIALWYAGNWMYNSPRPLNQWGGHIMRFCFWLDVLVVCVVSVLSMIDWMRSTVKKHQPLPQPDLRPSLNFYTEPPKGAYFLTRR